MFDGPIAEALSRAHAELRAVENKVEAAERRLAELNAEAAQVEHKLNDLKLTFGRRADQLEQLHARMRSL